MTGPDHEAIRAALAERFAAQITGPTPPSWDAEWHRTAEWLAPTVAALMEDYAADLRAEIERLREAAEHPQAGGALGITWPIDRLAPDGVSWHDHYKAEVERRGAAEADRDAYAAERVRAALIDAAEAVEADASECPECHLIAAARIVRDRASAS